MIGQLTYTTKQVAALINTTPRRVMIVCDYWQLKNTGVGVRREWTIDEIIKAGVRLQLLEAGLRKGAIDKLIGPWDGQ